MKNEIVIFKNQNVKLEVNLKDETVWLSAKQMSRLFKRDYKTIRKHISNAFDEELEINSSTIANFETVQKEGNRTIKRSIYYYSLDVIISVGYRVKSMEGIIFRKWATKVLKDYLLKGYSINKQRLDYLEKTVKLIDIASRIENSDTKDVLHVINRYTKALNLLDNYDHKSVIKPKGNIVNKKITYEECIKIIKDLKFNQDSSLFAKERDKGLESIINDIYQTYNSKELYPTLEEKASNFLYLLVKNHVFIDGNKRIGATLFIYFLNTHNKLYVDNKQIIDNNTLVAITLLIAESNPKEKEVITDLVMNFLTN